MTCPHCGATARTTDRFCPKCSRLIDSPLLRIKQELDAARAANRVERPQTPEPDLPSPARPLTPGPPVTPPPGKRGRKRAQRANLDSPAEHQPHATSLTEPAAVSQTRSAAQAPQAGQQAPAVRLTSALLVLVLFDLIILALLYGGVRFLEAMPPGTLGQEVSAVARVAAYLVGGLTVLAALGVWTLQPFGRALQRLAALLWLPVVPFGTLLGMALWVYLGRPGVRLLFSGRRGPQLSATEATQLAGSRKLAPVMAVLLVILHVGALLTVIGAAANLQPYLMEARTLRDAVDGLTGATPDPAPTDGGTVVNELRLFAFAQAGYARLNGGLYQTGPSACSRRRAAFPVGRRTGWTSTRASSASPASATSSCCALARLQTRARRVPPRPV